MSDLGGSVTHCSTLRPRPLDQGARDTLALPNKSRPHVCLPRVPADTLPFIAIACCEAWGATSMSKVSRGIRLLTDILWTIGTEKATLRLSGRLLAFNVHESGVLRSTHYPASSISVSHRRRFDGRTLIWGAVAPLLTILLYLALAALLERTIGIRYEAMSSRVDAVFLACLAGSFVFAAASALAFLFPRRTTALSVEAIDGTHMLEFWHRVGKDPELDHIVRRLERGAPGEAALDGVSPQRLDYEWSRCTSRSIAAAAGCLGAASMPLAFANAPPFRWILAHLRTTSLLVKYSEEHVRALTLFTSGEHDAAKRSLDQILARDPDDVNALSLLSVCHVEQDRFPEARKCCVLIQASDPCLGAQILERVATLEAWASGRVVPRPGSTQQYQQPGALVGARGTAVGALRPSGAVQIDGDRYQARAESEYIYDGTPIVVVSFDAFGLIVRVGEREADERSDSEQTPE